MVFYFFQKLINFITVFWGPGLKKIGMIKKLREILKNIRLVIKLTISKMVSVQKRTENLLKICIYLTLEACKKSKDYLILSQFWEKYMFFSLYFA